MKDFLLSVVDVTMFLFGILILFSAIFDDKVVNGKALLFAVPLIIFGEYRIWKKVEERNNA